MSEPKESRKVMLTFENPTEHGWTYEKILEKVKKLKADYWCISTEVGPETKTEHIHLAIYRNCAYSISAITNAFPNVHRDFCRGSMIEIRNYISKTGEKWSNSNKSSSKVSNTFREGGILPDEPKFKKTDSESSPSLLLKKYIDIGMNTAEIIEAQPSYIFQATKIMTARDIILANKYMNNTRELIVSYIYGDSGTGKTSGIYGMYKYKDVCRITNYKGDRVLFDSYSGQDVLVFEEFHSQIPIADMLSYLDIYPLMLPARYSDKPANYTKVYILSNIPLDSQYISIQHNDYKTWNALIRRIHCIKRQLSPGKQSDEPLEKYVLKGNLNE